MSVRVKGPGAMGITSTGAGRCRPPKRACSACGAGYSETEWTSLQLAERIDAPEVRRLVRDWPESFCVEVRRCRRCGHTIAAKREVPAA